MLIRSKAPVRICDIGGWTDTRFAGSGVVVNFAVDLYAHVIVFESDATPGSAEPRIEIDALDMGERIELGHTRDIEYDGVLDLLKAAVVRMGVDRSLRIVIWSDTPPGCGMGTSSSVGVALLAALGLAVGKPLPRHSLAELAHALEVEELKIECGVQDQYAAAFGGVQFMEVDFPHVRTSPLDLSEDFVHELNERFLVAYTGQSRLSDDVHRNVIRNYRAGAGQEREAIGTLRSCAHEMKNALLGQDFGRMGEIMNANWEAQKQLHPMITTPAIETAVSVAFANGAVGAKANGAGGGGSLTFLCAPGMEFQVRQALLELPGIRILPCSIAREGVRSWHSPR